MGTFERKDRGAVSRNSAEIAGLQDTWMTPEEAGSYLGLSTLALNQRRYTGTGPRYAKIGRLIRYRKAELDAWLTGDSEQVA